MEEDGATAMDAEFWIKAWNEGRTGFHRAEVHEKLVEHFPTLRPQEGQKVLVPLCGKTKDLLWLRDLHLRVHGIELHRPAVEAFFAENGLAPVQVVPEGGFIQHVSGDIKISCGDFFALRAPDAYDFVYDRAALVALPPPTRERYAGSIQSLLRTGGKILLITYEYDPSSMEGPPFSVGADEIERLYGDRCAIQLMERKPATKEAPRLAAVAGLQQTVYVLEKRT